MAKNGRATATAEVASLQARGIPVEVTNAITKYRGWQSLSVAQFVERSYKLIEVLSEAPNGAALLAKAGLEKIPR